MFKVGDQVVCVEASFNLEVGAHYTIRKVDLDGMCKVVNGDWYVASRFKLLVSVERQALSDAMDLCVKHDVRVGNKTDGGQFWHSSQNGMGHFSKAVVLEKVVPTKTKEQLEIEEVEGKLRVLADQLAELKAK